MIPVISGLKHPAEGGYDSCRTAKELGVEILMELSKPSWVKAVWMLNMAGTSVSINVMSSSVNTCTR